MSSNEEKAQQLIAEAEKKIASKGFFSSLFGSGNRVEEAVDCYHRGANLFKMAKNWSSAGKAFAEAATLTARSGARHDAATNYVDAANCYKKTDVPEAIKCLMRAIEIYTDMGRFTMAAKHHQTIAEMYESDLVDLKLSMENYEQAADYFRGEESTASANKCLLKIAQYASQLENYEKAIKLYEQVAVSALDSSLLKYTAKEYFFRAILCHLCVDALNAQQALERYESLYPAFTDSRESKLIKTLIEHIEEQNIEGYTNAVKEYDSISRLDQWYTTILLRIKKQLADNPDLR